MQNDRSSSQFSLHLQYISRKEMITARKTIRSTPSYRAIPSCLVEGSRSEGRNERKTSGEMRRRGGQYLGRASKSFLQRAWRSFFLFFSKYLLSISKIVETRLDFRVFLESLRYGEKRRRERTKERRRKEEGRWKEAREEDEGNSEGRKESHTMARMKRKKEKGWGSERKIDGGGMYHPAHSIFRVFLFCPLRQPDKGPSGEELAARYSPDQLETRCQMENSSE